MYSSVRNLYVYESPFSLNFLCLSDFNIIFVERDPKPPEYYKIFIKWSKCHISLYIYTQFYTYTQFYMYTQFLTYTVEGRNFLVRVELHQGPWIVKEK